MSGIRDLPPESDFGLEFNYAVWTPNTRVSLHNVPWSNDYRDVVDYATRAELDAYLDQPSNSGPIFTQMTAAPVSRPIRVDMPLNDVYSWNYLRVQNSLHDNVPPQRTFYYFILDVIYVAPNTTEIIVQLDVWQSFRRQVTLGNCYIEQGHIGVANSKQMDNNGRDYLTVPEGLDIGAEYEIKETHKETIATAATMDIIVASTISFAAPAGDLQNPIVNSSEGSDFEGLPNGVEFYLFSSVAEFKTYMAAVSDTPWRTQGIISVMAVPDLASYDMDIRTIVPPDSPQVKQIFGRRAKNSLKIMGPGFRDRVIPSRYQHLKKFATYPYTVVEATTYSGAPLVLKPESMGGDAISFMFMLHLALPSPRFVAYPFQYNGTDVAPVMQGAEFYNDMAEFLDVQTGIYDMPTFSVVNNGYMQFMANNAHSLAFQNQSAEWSQQRALTGNQLGYDQASAGMGLSNEMTNIGIDTSTQQTALANDMSGMRALQGGANSMLGGIGGGGAGLAGGALGAANAALGHALSVHQNDASLAINTGAARRSNSAQVGNAGYMRDTNKAYADYAAKGDYQNTIGALNAKIQDARVTAPSTVGQLGGNAFLLSNYEWALHAKVKVIQGAARASIGEYWLRYGYKINRFSQIDTLRVMSKFSYWKLRETYIRSSTCPETFRQAIRGILEKGVTVWVNPNDIGRIDIADNAPLGGITL